VAPLHDTQKGAVGAMVFSVCEMTVWGKWFRDVPSRMGIVRGRKSRASGREKNAESP